MAGGGGNGERLAKGCKLPGKRGVSPRDLRYHMATAVDNGVLHN